MNIGKKNNQKKLYTVKPALTATSDKWPTSLKRPVVLVPIVFMVFLQ